MYNNRIILLDYYNYLSVVWSEGGAVDNVESSLSSLINITTDNNEAYIEFIGNEYGVYISFIRAGLGHIFCFIFVLLILIGHQTTYLYGIWWLATWSQDEGHRHGHFNSCTSANVENINYIRSMSDDDWNAHRNRRFYIYCGQYNQIQMKNNLIFYYRNRNIAPICYFFKCIYIEIHVFKCWTSTS